MLVLSRKQNQEIIIGDNIKITVLKMKGNTVRIGIEAPMDVSIRRGELPEKVTAVAEAKSNSSDESGSEYTVVFNNVNETTSSRSDVLPFNPEQASDSGKTATNRNGLEQYADEKNPIQFNGQLPESFRHNRLKEIVNRLTSSSVSPANSDSTN